MKKWMTLPLNDPTACSPPLAGVSACLSRRAVAPHWLGFNLVEVLVSLSIFAVAFTAMMLGTSALIKGNTATVDMQQDRFLVSQLYGEVSRFIPRGDGFQDITDVVNDPKAERTLPNGRKVWVTREYYTPANAADVKKVVVHLYKKKTDTTPYRSFQRDLNMQDECFAFGTDAPVPLDDGRTCSGWWQTARNATPNPVTAAEETVVNKARESGLFWFKQNVNTATYVTAPSPATAAGPVDMSQYDYTTYGANLHTALAAAQAGTLSVVSHNFGGLTQYTNGAETNPLYKQGVRYAAPAAVIGFPNLWGPYTLDASGFDYGNHPGVDYANQTGQYCNSWTVCGGCWNGWIPVYEWRHLNSNAAYINNAAPLMVFQTSYEVPFYDVTFVVRPTIANQTYVLSQYAVAGATNTSRLDENPWFKVGQFTGGAVGVPFSYTMRIKPLANTFAINPAWHSYRTLSLNLRSNGETILHAVFKKPAAING